MANQVRMGILTSLRQILEKRVLPSLSPLMTNPKLDKELQVQIQESFPEFCRSTQNNSPPTIDGIKAEDFKMEMDGESMIVSTGSESVLAPPSSLIPAIDPNEPTFSDDEDPDDIPIGKFLFLSNIKFAKKNNRFLLLYLAAKLKMKNKTSTTTTNVNDAKLDEERITVRTIPAQLQEISKIVAQLEGDVKVYVDMLVRDSDNESR